MFFGLCAMVVAMAACNQSGYRVNGVAEGFSEGDTLYYYDEMGQETPSDTIVVKDGKFTLSGEVDSVKLCSIAAADGSAGALFFKEEGTISVSLSRTETSKVGGTKSNTAWQKVLDLEQEFNAKVDPLLEPLYNGSDLTEEQRQEILDSYQALQKEMMAKGLDIAEENVDNALGYMLLTSFGDMQGIDPARLKAIIEKMPAEYRQREEVVELLKSLEVSEKTAVGKTMPDFTLPTPDGEQLSALAEVAKSKVTILDFWASWCGPCCEEMPSMVSLYEKYQGKGLGILGISLDMEKDNWKEGIAKMGMTWTQVGDMNGWNTLPVELFQVKAIPFMVIVDHTGTILEKGLRGAELEAFIEKTLK